MSLLDKVPGELSLYIGGFVLRLVRFRLAQDPVLMIPQNLHIKTQATTAGSKYNARAIGTSLAS